MAVGVVGNTFPSTVVPGQVVTDQNIADTGATIGNLYQSPGAGWFCPTVGCAVTGTMGIALGVNGNLQPILKATGASAATGFIIPLPNLRVGQIITSIDVLASNSNAANQTVNISKMVGIATGGSSPTSSSLATAANISNASIYTKATITLTAPETVSASASYYLVWQAVNNTGDFIMAVRLY